MFLYTHQTFYVIIFEKNVNSLNLTLEDKTNFISDFLVLFLIEFHHVNFFLYNLNVYSQHEIIHTAVEKL